MRIVLCPTLHQHEREVTLLDRLMRGTTDGAVLMLPEESSDGAEGAAAGLPVRRRRSARVARRGDPRRLGGARRRRPRSDRAPARARPPPHRSDHRPARVDREHGPSQRLPRRACRRRRACPIPRSSPSRISATAPSRRPRPTRCSTSPILRLRSLRSTTIRGRRLSAARERGLRIPDDLSVVGFDDSELAEIVTPGLTTVRQPLAEMGRMAVSLLMRLLENQRVDALRIELATKLVVRESTAPVPSRIGGKP